MQSFYGGPAGQSFEIKRYLSLITVLMERKLTQIKDGHLLSLWANLLWCLMACHLTLHT